MSEPDAPMPSFRPRLFTRGAAIRLGVFAGAVALLSLYGWSRTIRMPGRSYAGALPALTADEQVLRDRLRGHVETLAARIGARSTSAPAGLARAEAYVRAELAGAGYTVTDEVFRADGMACRNFIVERAGASRRSEVVIIGAHYDGVLDKPAANDNASGTAALIELARAFARVDVARTLRFVAFTNEEPHHFQTESMGSLVNARRARRRGDDVVAMVSLETVGYYDLRAGSQRYPPPLSLFYPDRGDFIAFVGSTEMAPLVRHALATFRAGARFPSEGTALSARTPGVGWSDHWSYWQVG
ncbi:MAG: M28 family peptidase [Deltaproteobacteria bacterium]|nr:M28 family peptidase [Myxococcales bacterium]MDP3221153.1 M28 family peptidase [Deltaproteobacteria bacterium]